MESCFCTNCGAELLGGASFCVECGQRQAGAVAQRTGIRFSWQWYAPVLVVLGVVVVTGGAVLFGRLAPVTAPSVPRQDGSQSVAAGNLPEGHPPIAIPEEVKQAIRDLAKKAEAAPDDLDMWKHLAEVQYRAGQIDPSYLTAAAEAYHHILEREPGNLDIIRNLGNIAYDQDQHDVAISYYQRYLKEKPDDPDVRTDLGTMYLSSGKTDEAIQIWDGVLKTNPSFFQAQFNLGIAYGRLSQTDKAIAALEKARALAGDDATRSQVDQVLARAQAPASGGLAAAAPEAPAPPAQAPPAQAPAEPAANAPAGSFQADAEAMFRQAPILGPKVQRLEWTGAASARVYLQDFPFDQMPDDMKTTFADRMRERIKEQKDSHKVAEATRFDLVDETTGKVMETITE